MSTRHAREITLEEFHAWHAATKRFQAVAQAADEEGGPRLSLVPAPDHAKPWPTDLLPPPPDPAAAADPSSPAADPSAPTPAGAAPQPDAAPAAAAPQKAEPFDGVALPDSRRRMGWSAERQRLFLGHLAESGSVHLASAAARLTARSAYQLRARSPAFAAAWETAEQLAAGRLAALAFDRAISGRVEQVWRDGDLVAERRVPNDRMLMWLLARLDPRRFAAPADQLPNAADPQAAARDAFPALLAGLADLPAE